MQTMTLGYVCCAADERAMQLKPKAVLMVCCG
jgi:hypothetical protein